MKIEHIAIYVNDLEIMRTFYMNYFNAASNSKYENSKKGFSSYFLSFENGCRLELMDKTNVTASPPKEEHRGIIHFAMSVGSTETVNKLTERIRNDGYQIVGEPRTTGDGYYESVILDPEGNRIEITI